VLEVDVINRLCTTKEARRLRKWEGCCSLVLFTPLHFTEASSSSEYACKLSTASLSFSYLSKFPDCAISDCLCLTILSWFSCPHFRAFERYLRLRSSKITRKNAPRRQLVWAHRDEITSYASRSRRCNAIATTQMQRHQHFPSLLSRALHRPLFFHRPIDSLTL